MKPKLTTDIGLFSMAVVVTAVVFSLSFFRSVEENVAPPEDDVSQLPKSELLQKPLTEPVCDELLSRPDLPTSTLVAAVRRLGRLRNEKLADTFIALINQLDDSSPITRLRNLSKVCLHVVEQDPSGQGALRSRLDQLATSAQTSSIRKVAFASQIEIDDSTAKVFAETRASHFIDRIESLALVNRFSVSDDLYDRLRPFIVGDGQNEIRDDWQSTAIQTAVEMPDAHAILAIDLIQLLGQEKHNESAFDGLLDLSVDVLPEDQLGFVAALLVARLAQLSTSAESLETDHLVHRCLEIAERLPADKRSRLLDRVKELTTHSQ